MCIYFLSFYSTRNGFIIQIYVRHKWAGFEETSPTKCIVRRIRGCVCVRPAATGRKTIKITFFFYLVFVDRHLSVELLRLLDVHIRRSNDDVTRLWTHHLRCCDGNKFYFLFIFSAQKWDDFIQFDSTMAGNKHALSNSIHVRSLVVARAVLTKENKIFRLPISWASKVLMKSIAKYENWINSMSALFHGVIWIVVANLPSEVESQSLSHTYHSHLW